jgi:hypothetical protein
MMERTQRSVVSSTQNPLSFNSSWTVEDVDTFFRKHFPTAFEYADSVRGSEKIHWLLVSKERLTLEVVDAPAPNGALLENFKGRSQSSVKDSHIYIGKYTPDFDFCFPVMNC